MVAHGRRYPRAAPSATSPTPDRLSRERQRPDIEPPAFPSSAPHADHKSRERQRPDTRYPASMPGEPVAYLLTWTCYGTWLHGDERWSINKGHNDFHGPSIGPHQRMERAARARMKGDIVLLTPAMRRIAGGAIREHAAHKGWTTYAVNVRTNHAHAVITAPGRRPDPVLVQVKGWATRALREAGLFAADARVWTKGGSKRWLWDEKGLREAIAYVMERQ